MVRVFTGTLVAAVLAVAMVGAQQVGAQQPPAAPPQKPAQPSESRPPSDTAKAQTITGCVEKGTGADSFILAEAGTGAAPAPGAKPGEKPAGTSGATKSYALMAKPTEDLSKHVGHKVEITGTVIPASSPAPGSPKESLNVQSVKMVAASCP
jgi:hypothetical protein